MRLFCKEKQNFNIKQSSVEAVNGFPGDMVEMVNNSDLNSLPLSELQYAHHGMCLEPTSVRDSSGGRRCHARNVSVHCPRRRSLSRGCSGSGQMLVGKNDAV
ncbi:hypothetical protein SLA2020_461900 [Shorea laevis]